MTLLSHKLIENGAQMKTNIPDFDVSLKKISSTRSQFFAYKLRLLNEKKKKNPNFLRTNKYSDRQTNLFYLHRINSGT